MSKWELLKVFEDMAWPDLCFEKEPMTVYRMVSSWGETEGGEYQLGGYCISQ